MSAGRILLTGGTGYVGGRLLRRLADGDRPVRVAVRRPDELRGRVPEHVEVVHGDVLDDESLTGALRDVDTAYYLVHSMGAGADFEERDRRAAECFASAAAAAGVTRIVYLGGLSDTEGELSPHMRSRLEVGRILRESGVPTLELRASIVIGSGSLSFEMVRALVERLPVMLLPRWVSQPAQPIAVEDLLEYLLEALDVPLPESRVFEIGGTDVVSYEGLLREYARQRGLRRLLLPVPLLTPNVSALWLRLVTPLYAGIGSQLIASVRHGSVVRDFAANDTFRTRPRGVRAALESALRNEDRELAETRWSDALSSSRGTQDWGGRRLGSRIVDSRMRPVDVSAAAAFAPVRRIGGETGWYYGNWLWSLRGLLDLLVGGPGMRRGRRDPEVPEVGSTLDLWRVDAYEPDRLLRLRAEMRLPGRAWLEFEVDEVRPGRSHVRQTAIFDPLGLFGLAYWYALFPLHELVFRGMLRGIAAAAERDGTEEPGAAPAATT